MAVHKHHGSWTVTFRWRGLRVHRRSPVNSSKGAHDYEATLRTRLLRGEPLDVAPIKEQQVPTFAEFVEIWLHDYVDGNNKPSECASKRRILRTDLLPVFGKLRLDEIRNRHVERYKRAKQIQGQSNKTINNALTVLRKCLDTAIEWEEIEDLPRIKFLKISPPDWFFFDDSELERLLASAPEGLWRTMVLTAAKTGLRFSELIALEWSDIQPIAGGFVLRVMRDSVDGIVSSPKNYQRRDVPLTSDVAHALLALPRKCRLIFHMEARTILRDTASWRLDRFCRQAGLRHAGWHTLRHTYGSALALRGVPILTISKLMGHQSTKMTEKYSHLRPSALTVAVSLLEAPLDRQPGDSQPPFQTWNGVIADQLQRPNICSDKRKTLA